MCDDSFNIATVPRHAKFGAQTGNGDGDDESTLGDRFFDLLPLQTDSVAKTDLGNCMSLRDGCKPVPCNIQQHLEQIPTIAVTATTTITDTTKVTTIGTIDGSAENIHGDAPFELNRLAMFRPSSRTRLSGCRSNTVLREENAVHLPTCTVELSCQNFGLNSYVDKETANHTSKISSSGSNQLTKTLRYNVSRPSFPTQVSHVQPVEMKQRMGSVTYQPTIKVRATSAEPRIQKPAMSFMRTNSSSIRKAMETAVRTESRGPLRVRSASTNATATNNIGAKAENAVGIKKVTMGCRQNRANLTSRTVVSSGKMASKPEATRKSLYAGPETRARARMKESNENSAVMRINPAVSTPKQSVHTKSVHSRPLSQMNSNITRNAVANSTAVCNTKKVEIGHISRPRTRVAHEPIRVRNTHGIVKNGDSLPPVESESRFRQSLTRRPKGGDSLDRDVTKAEDKENDEIWTVVAKKAESILEFAPCLRSRVAAKKVQSTTPTISGTHFTRPTKTGHSKHGGSDILPAPRRRTEAEREAFFRRLSTPKTIVTIKKCTK